MYIGFISLFMQCATSAKINKERGAIRDIMHKQEQTWNAGSIDEFMKVYWQSDSLRFIGSSGITYGYENTLNNYKKHYDSRDKMGRLQFKILHLERLAKDAYTMVGKYTLYRKKDEPSGYFTLIWKRINGNWRIVSDQSN